MSRHTLSSGVVVVQDGSALLVYEKGQWGLPKGGVEFDEPVKTGLEVMVRGLAFVSEFRRTEWNEHHLQTYFVADVVGGTLLPNDPDDLVKEVRFVPIDALRQYLTFRPIIITLEQWLMDWVPRYPYFDLDLESEDV